MATTKADIASTGWLLTDNMLSPACKPAAKAPPSERKWHIIWTHSFLKITLDNLDLQAIIIKY